MVRVVLVLRTVPDLVLAGLVVLGPGPVLVLVPGPGPGPGLSLVPGRVSDPRSRPAWCAWTRSSLPLKSGKRSSVAETRSG